MSFLERFFSKIKKTKTCWLWTASKNNDGYGHFKYEGKMLKAHRISFIIFRKHIPSGMQVLHKCDNPSCVNPKHLFLGSHKDNMLDRNKKGRQSKGVNRPSVKLTEKQVKDIRSRKMFYGCQTIWAKEFGVKQNLISRIINRVIWKHI